MKDKINLIKNKIYEAEGLLELISLREDKADDLLPMIKDKLQEALRLLTTADDKRENPQVEIETQIESDKPEVVYEAAANTNQPAFCLNDRYRFRRALFGGSDAEFNAVMDHIATLSNYEEAEEFLFGELGFEAENEDVADFTEIIKNYFKA